MKKLLSVLLVLLLSASLAFAVPLSTLPNPDNYKLLETAERQIRSSDGSALSIQLSLMVSLDGQHMITVAYYKGRIVMLDGDAQDPDAPVLVDKGFCPTPDGSFPVDGVFTEDFVQFSQCPNYKKA